MAFTSPLTNQDHEILVDKATELKKKDSDELAVTLSWSYNHFSAMSEQAKAEARKQSPTLAELLDNTIRTKGEVETVSKKAGKNKIEVDGMSQMALHSFILEAEKLGKSIKYIKTLTVELSD